MALEHDVEKPLRKYEYLADDVPYHKFNDWQGYCDLVEGKNHEFTAILPAKSITFFATDYVDRVPSEITSIELLDGKLVWDKSEDAEHCYYRVYCNGERVASTVAEYIYTDKDAEYQVFSVDKYGNCIVK